MSRKKYFLSAAVFVFAASAGLFIAGCSKETGEKGKAGEEKKILYYASAMHPSVRVSEEAYNKGDTQCPICNMDLYPVYEQAEEKDAVDEPQIEENIVRLSSREIELAGIKTFEVGHYPLSKEITAAGKIAYDPELVIAEREYVTAIKAAGQNAGSDFLEEAAYKLRLLGLNDTMINELRKTKKVHTNLILPEKTVWVYADIYESEIGLIEEGMPILVEATAYPGEYFKGNIKAIDSVLNPRTRALRVRAEIHNRDMKLKPEMYVRVTISKQLGRQLAVPLDAVLDTGKRKIVYVDMGQGSYMGREVETGHEAEAVINMQKQKMVNIKKGVSRGDMVVVRANFLIDSQSQLSGSAAAQYGGALDGDGQGTSAPAHIGH